MIVSWVLRFLIRIGSSAPSSLSSVCSSFKVGAVVDFKCFFLEADGASLEAYATAAVCSDGVIIIFEIAAIEVEDDDEESEG